MSKKADMHDGERSHNPDPKFSRLCNLAHAAKLNVQIHHSKDEGLRYTAVCLVDEKGRTPYSEPIVDSDIPAATSRLVSSLDAANRSAA